MARTILGGNQGGRVQCRLHAHTNFAARQICKRRGSVRDRTGIGNFYLGKTTMNSNFWRAGLVALMVGAVAGCGGGGGGGDAGVAAPAVPAGPTLAAAPVPAGNAPVDAGALTADQFAALTAQIVFGGALVGSPPQVSFAIQDANGNAIKGIGSQSQSATATLKSYPNLAFSFAKLVPGANGAPSRWVSY